MIDGVDDAAHALYGLGARAVWLFGSLARDGPVDERSDIDLAVAGLPAEVVAAAAATVTAWTGRHVDIVAVESMPPGLRASLVRASVLVPRNGAATHAAGLVARRRRPVSLHRLRHEVVHDLLREHDARSVLDLGCGTGALLVRLAGDLHFTRLTGVDLDDDALAVARTALVPRRSPAVQLIHGLVTSRDPRLLGHTAATAVELIEHLDEPRLAAFESVLFGYLRPQLILVSTPNADYNPLYGLAPEAHRLPGHRFEWNRAEFATWVARHAHLHGYAADLRSIGPRHPTLGAPTQLAVLTRARD